MSEQNDDVSGCISIAIGISIVVVAVVLLLNRLDRQEHYIRDLQQRIATLEQERR